jgi:hypothetical protein
LGRENFVELGAERFGQGAILFAEIEQGHAHRAQAWQLRMLDQVSTARCTALTVLPR